MGELSKSVEPASLGGATTARPVAAIGLRRLGIPLLLLGLVLALVSSAP